MLLLDFLYHALTLITGPSKPKDLTPPNTPPPTSRKRHDSMNSAKMHANNVQVVQEVPSAKEAGVKHPNTGFPEPLSPDRNTTLPHPDADTSKNATIEAKDVPLARRNSRRGFLYGRHHSYKSVTSKGKIDPADAGLHDDIQYADGSKEKDSGVKMTKMEAEHNGVATNGAVKEGVVENGVKGEESSGDDLKLGKERDEQGYHEGERKKGVLRKLRLHKV